MEIHLFFSISMLPSIALKHWNFPDNLDFKGKISAIFLTRSPLLSIWNNMTIKQQINYGTIQKVCHLHKDIFHPIQLYHTLSILLYCLPCAIHTKKTMERQKRRFFVRMADSAYHVISKEVENYIVDTIAFLDTHVYVNNPYWQSSGIIIILCK